MYFRQSYSHLVKSLLKRQSVDLAMSAAVGGEFEAIGMLERELLIYLGLETDEYLIDVGCGSGRLAKSLSQYLGGSYLGIDIVPELLEYAAKITRRPDWRFEVAPGLSIPENNGQADMVCFFSVFTHLLHEHSYLYLKEAKRVLKPSGKIVFSFLEFATPHQWKTFEAAIARKVEESHPLTIFIGRDAIEAWASHLNLKVEHIFGGDEAFIPLSRPITFEDGGTMNEKGQFGQSVCVLTLQ